jgi:hypothetical protein
MARDFTQRPPRWFQRARSLVLIAAGCALPLAAAIAAPQTPPGEARIWFYRGFEPPSGGANYSPASIPTIAANGTYVGPAPSGSVFYRDVPAGHYDITIPTFGGFQYQYQSANFDLRPGHQAFVKIVLIRGNNSKPWQYWSGFGALLVPEQLAQAEVVPTLVADGGQR